MLVCYCTTAVHRGVRPRPARLCYDRYEAGYIHAPSPRHELQFLEKLLWLSSPSAVVGCCIRLLAHKTVYLNIGQHAGPVAACSDDSCDCEIEQLGFARRCKESLRLRSADEFPQLERITIALLSAFWRSIAVLLRFITNRICSLPITMPQGLFLAATLTTAAAMQATQSAYQRRQNPTPASTSSRGGGAGGSSTYQTPGKLSYFSRSLPSAPASKPKGRR